MEEKKSKIVAEKSTTLVTAISKAIDPTLEETFKIKLRKNIDGNPNIDTNFTCKWIVIEKTIKRMLGQSPNIERLSQYIDKENWGESTLQQALNQIDIFHEDKLNNKKNVFRSEDGSIKDFEMNKNSMKIMSAFKLIRQLPETFEPIRQNLMNDMSNAFYNPEITYASLVKEAEKRAKATGQMNIFSEYKIPEQTNGLSRYDRKVFKKGITDQQEPKDERKALLKYITDNNTGEKNC